MGAPKKDTKLGRGKDRARSSGSVTSKRFSESFRYLNEDAFRPRSNRKK